MVKNSKFNPCPVYVLEENIILIHASYVCPRGDQFFSASKDILDLLPGQIKIPLVSECRADLLAQIAYSIT